MTLRNVRDLECHKGAATDAEVLFLGFAWPSNLTSTKTTNHSRQACPGRFCYGKRDGGQEACKYLPSRYPDTLPKNRVVMLRSIRTKDHCFKSLLSVIPTSGAPRTISKTHRIEATHTVSNIKPKKISYLSFPVRIRLSNQLILILSKRSCSKIHLMICA